MMAAVPALMDGQCMEKTSHGPPPAIEFHGNPHMIGSELWYQP